MGGSAMRKQYHPRQVGDTVLVWDVDRLIELAEELPEQRVSLDSIWEMDEVRWFNDEKHRPTCRELLDHMRLVMDANPSYPILLGEDGRVMDGMHRVLRVALEGGNEIAAKRFEVDPEPDYLNVDLDDLPY